MNPHRVLLILFSSLFASCSHMERSGRAIDMDEISSRRGYYNDRDVAVEGCITYLESNSVHLSNCDDFSGGDAVGGHIDLVGGGVDEEWWRGEKKVCVYGKFRSYSRDMVGIGNLTSNIGIIEVRNIIFK